MEQIDWTFAVSLAATLALAVGAICILLFAMWGVAGKMSGTMRHRI
jgi:hypothetical protein